MTRGYADYLRDILTAIKDVQSFVASIDLDDFLASKEKQYAVMIGALEIIGEAAAQVPAEVRARFSAVPWREMVGMRNVVIHNYFGVDEHVIWRTVQDDLPPLKKAIARILKDLESNR